MRRAQAGDHGALEALLRHHHGRLHGVCRRVLGNDVDADDATQEALVAIVRGLPGFDRRSRFSTWSYRIAVNAALDEVRRRRRRPEPVDHDSSPELALAASTERSPEAAAERLDIDAALQSLSVEYRAAVVLRDLCQLDYQEISDVLGIPPGTVRSRIARGRSALAERLGNPEPGARRPTGQP